MKRLSTFLILIILSLVGCEKNVSLTPKVDRFIVSKHLLKMDGSEKLPKNIQHLIEIEQNRSLASEEIVNLAAIYSPKNHPKFPLPYYLVPRKDVSFAFTHPTNDKIDDQLVLRISGKRHNKLFIHPGQEGLFDFLKHRYSYIGPESTEFFATPTSKSTSLLVWNKNNSERLPFIVEVNQPKAMEQNRKISSLNSLGAMGDFLGSQVVKEIPVNNAK